MQSKSLREKKYDANLDLNHEHDWELWLHSKSKRFANDSPPKRCFFVCHCGKYKIRDMEEVEE